MKNVNTVADVLALVAAMNKLSDAIDPNYGKIAVFLKEEADGDECAPVSRYFIQKRATMSEDGIERWSFVARKSQ